MRPSRDSRRSAPAREGRSACAGAATSCSTTTRCVPCLNLPLISHTLVLTFFLLKRGQPRLDGRALTMRELQVDPTLTAQRAVHDSLSPAAFRRLLEPIRTTECIVCYVVDIFDFHGTFLPDLTDIVGAPPLSENRLPVGIAEVQDRVRTQLIPLAQSTYGVLCLNDPGL